MKAHKYWSLGALFCMTGSFYTGYRKFMKAHKYFSFGTLFCMIMAIWSGHKMITPSKDRRKKNVLLTTNNCKYEIKIDRT